MVQFSLLPYCVTRSHLRLVGALDIGGVREGVLLRLGACFDRERGAVKQSFVKSTFPGRRVRVWPIQLLCQLYSRQVPPKGY